MPRRKASPLPTIFLLLLFPPSLAVTQTPFSPKRHDTVTLSFTGPSLSETSTPNPFVDYRFTLTVTHNSSGISYKVAGYYAADGNAGETGATSGKIWRAHFTPSRIGVWTFQASFRTGDGAASAKSDRTGTAIGFDGERGRFMVEESEVEEPDLRARGRLEYVGQRYLRFGNGGYFLKVGTNTPENFLAYTDFDADEEIMERFRISYKAHVRDWKIGDPTWGKGRGKGIVGAVNYLAEVGVNSVFGIVLTVRGDSEGAVHPWTRRKRMDRYDVSKLDQWGVVFDHASRKGLALNLAFCETENEALFEYEAGISTRSGFAEKRKVFYREIIARFGHHLGIVYTLGEENGWNERTEDGGGFPWGKGNSDGQRRVFTQFIRGVDAYDSAIGVHTLPVMKSEIYTPMLGPDSGIWVENANMQVGMKINTYNETRKWIAASVDAGLPWVVTVDEIGSDGPGMAGGVPLVGTGMLNSTFRSAFVWGNLMGGGAGVEVFNAGTDQTLGDFRQLDTAWRTFGRAVGVLKGVKFWAMEDGRRLVFPRGVGEDGVFVYCLAVVGDVYVVYRAGVERVWVDLEGVEGRFFVRWFDPRVGGGGGEIGEKGNVEAGGQRVDLGIAPRDNELDWVVVLERVVGGGSRRGGFTMASPHDLIRGAVDMGSDTCARFCNP